MNNSFQERKEFNLSQESKSCFSFDSGPDHDFSTRLSVILFSF